MTTTLDAQRIKAIFKSAEMRKAPRFSQRIVVSEGVQMNSVRFDRATLEAHTDEITHMLGDLPYSFRKEDGFYNAFSDRDGKEWTTSPTVVDMLVMLGKAIDKVKFTAPRGIWSGLPHGATFQITI